MGFRWSEVIWLLFALVGIALVVWLIIYWTKPSLPEPSATSSHSNGRPRTPHPLPPSRRPGLIKIPSMAYKPGMDVHRFWLDHDRDPGYAWRQTADVLQKQTQMRNNLKYGVAFFPTSDYQFLHPWFSKQR